MSDKTKRDMMGSRADMISGKFDEVSRNSIWRECMKRERAAVRGSSEFTLNPATLKPVAMKPTSVVPGAKPDIASEDLAALRELLKASTRTPQEKSDYPVSGTQAIGWFHGEVVDTVPRMPKNSCQEVKYAESYVAMTGLNPYMKKK